MPKTFCPKCKTIQMFNFLDKIEAGKCPLCTSKETRNKHKKDIVFKKLNLKLFFNQRRLNGV